MILAFLFCCGLVLVGLLKKRPWLGKGVIALIIVTPLLLAFTWHVRRFTFSDELWLAVADGDLPRARKMLSWGADPDYRREGREESCLQLARKLGNREMVRLLESAER